MIVTLSPRPVARGLWIILAALLLAHGAGQFSKHAVGHDVLLGFVRQFDLDREGNVPTWFQSGLFLIAASLLAAIARVRRQERAPYAWHWAALALIFVGLSADEAASLHEMAVKPLRTLLHARGLLHFTWVVPGAAFVLAVGLAYLRFLLHLPALTRRRFVVAGGLFVGGALGMELAGGWAADFAGQESLLYAAMATIEETLEMAGLVVFVHALLCHLRDEIGELTIRLDP